jgi:hypothetical protein
VLRWRSSSRFSSEKANSIKIRLVEGERPVGKRQKTTAVVEKIAIADDGVGMSPRRAAQMFGARVPKPAWHAIGRLMDAFAERQLPVSLVRLNACDPKTPKGISASAVDVGSLG